MELRVLGPVEAWKGSERVPLGGPKQRTVLALLVAAGLRPVMAEVLIDALWGESANARTKGTLQTYVSTLRRALGADVMVRDGAAYRLALARDRVDVWRFEDAVAAGRRLVATDPLAAVARLGEALSLWRGRPYTGVGETRQLDIEIRRLEELRLESLEDRIEAQLSLGGGGALVSELDALTREHPWRERLRGQLMVALYRAGRQVDALHVYDQSRAYLVEEVGVDPSPALRELHRRVLEQDPSLESGPAIAAGAAATAGASGGGAPPQGGTSTLRLPTASRGLVGRDVELAELVGLLADPLVRLVTVTGVGGVGKTRLALAAASSVGETFVDGVFLVDLAAVDSAAFVTSALLESVDLPASGEQGLDALVGWLSGRRVLVLLDNFEHVLDAAPTIATLLADAPGLTCLATSRVRLHVSSEWELPLAPLPIPDADQAGEWVASPVVRLLVERAVAGGAQANITDDATTLLEICKRLDGVPLAVELAAARLRTMPPPVLLERLATPLTVLTGGYRDLPDRQRSVRDTLAWSYSLLGSDEQQLFADLSVFTGEFSLAAAEAVCRDDLPADVEVVDLLAGLTDHSLLVPVGDSDEARFRMLHTVREYARQQLNALGRDTVVLQRHTDHYLGCVTELEPALAHPDEASHLARFDRDYANVRAAIWRLLDEPATVDLACIASNLYGYWAAQLRLLGDGLQWLQAALPVADTQRSRARLSVLAARLALMACHPVASSVAEQAVTSARAISDAHALCEALHVKASAAAVAGDFGLAEQVVVEALQRNLDSPDERLRCYLLTLGIDTALEKRNESTAAHRVEELLRIANESDELRSFSQLAQVYQAKVALLLDDPDGCLAALPDPGSLEWNETQRVGTLSLQGAAFIMQGRTDEAMPALHEVLMRAWEAGVVWDTRRALNGLAAIASLQARSEIAATLTNLASLIAERSGHAPTRIEADIFLPLIAESTERLTATDWQTHTSTARQLLDRGTIQGVIELILTLTEE